MLEKTQATLKKLLIVKAGIWCEPMLSGEIEIIILSERHGTISLLAAVLHIVHFIVSSDICGLAFYGYLT